MKPLDYSLLGSRPFRIFVMLFVFLLVVTVFVHTTANDFVDYDDYQYVTENLKVMNGLTLGNLKWAFTAGHGAHWGPLSWLSHMLDVELFGVNPAGHHLTSVLIHASSTVLLFLLLEYLGGSFYASVAVSLLFALHPLRVESVAWVAERKDVLFVFFYIAALYCYAVWSRKTSPVYYILAFFSFIFSMLSKPMAMSLPLALLLLDYWPLNRFVLFDRSGKSLLNDRRFHINLTKRLTEKIPFFAGAVVSGFIAVIMQSKGGALSNFDAIPLTFRLENALVSYVRYIEKLIWPSELAVLYPYPLDYYPVLTVAVSMFVLLVLTVFAIRFARSYPLLLFGWLWFVVTFIPVIGIIQFGSHSMADRFTYIPCIGLFTACVFSIDDFVRERRIVRRFAVVFVVLWIVVLGGLSHRQVRIWNTTERLFQHALDVTSDNHVIQNYMGVILLKEQRNEEAYAYLREAVRINPENAKARLDLARSLILLGQADKAADIYRAVLTDHPENANAHNEYGIYLAERGRLDEAYRHFQKVLQLDPDFSGAYLNIGMIYEKRGQFDEAIDNYMSAISSGAGSVEALSNLGNVYQMTGRLDESESWYLKAIEYDTDSSEVHYNLGTLYEKKGMPDKALEKYRDSISIDAGMKEAYNNMGTVYAGKEEWVKAVQHYETALKIDPEYRDAKFNLDVLTQHLKSLR